MTQVFISYSRKDISFVEQLSADLKNAGIDVWYDTSIRGGSNWREEIEDAIRNSQFILVVLSPDSMVSEWVNREFLYASNLDRKIIPLYYRECELTLNYVDLNYIDVQGASYQKNFDEILVALDRHPIPQPPAAPSQKRLNSNVAFGAVILVVILAMIGYIFVGGRKESPTPVPTTTVPATIVMASHTSTVTTTFTVTATRTPERATFTPVTPTHTLTPTVTAIPPVPIGSDWLKGCISTLWKPYPASLPVTEKGNGCWKEPVHVFRAENGDLDFLEDRGKGNSEIYGLFVPLPDQGAVTLKTQLIDLNNAEVWMGVFSEDKIDSPGLLMVIPAGNVKKRVFVQKDPLTNKVITSTNLLDQENGYSITFNFDENSASSKINPNIFKTNPVPISSSPKWLFLGYRCQNGPCRINGRFFSFVLNEE